MNNQTDVNLHFQERISDHDAQWQVLTAFVIGLIETHHDPEALRKRFEHHAETIEASALTRAVPESHLNAMREYRSVISRAFARTR